MYLYEAAKRELDAAAAIAQLTEEACMLIAIDEVVLGGAE